MKRVLSLCLLFLVIAWVAPTPASAAYLYETTSGSARWVQGSVWQYWVTGAADTSLDALVSENILMRSPLPDASLALTGTVPTFRLVTTSGVVQGAPGTTGAGASADAGTSGEVIKIIQEGRTVLTISEADIAADALIVAAPGGKGAAYQAVDVDLQTNETTLAEDDFDNSVWVTSGETVKLATSADNASAQGANVFLSFVDENDAYGSEIVALSAVDSSILVASTTLVKKLLSIAVTNSLGGVDLQAEFCEECNYMRSTKVPCKCGMLARAARFTVHYGARISPPEMLEGAEVIRRSLRWCVIETDIPEKKVREHFAWQECTIGICE